MTVSDAVRFIWEHLQRRRGPILAVAALVVFVTTYLLILPAITLDKEKAAEQGGIDVPAAEEMQADTEEGDGADSVDKSDAKAGQADGEPANDGEPDEQVSEEEIFAEDPSDNGSLSFSGDGYQITASAEADADLPKGTELFAQEITSENEDYEAWCEEAIKALDESEKDGLAFALKSARFYDISLLAADQVIEPSAPVQVKISYDKAMKVSDADHVRIIHFAVDKDGNLKLEVLNGNDVELSLEKTKKDESPKVSEVTFDAPSFSVYAIVDAPEDIYEEGGNGSVHSLDQIIDMGDEGFYVSNQNLYLTGELVHGVSGNSDRDGLKTTSQASETIPSSAVKFYFEPVGDTGNQFLIYTIQNGQSQYVKMTSVSGNTARAGLTMVADQNGATPFNLEQAEHNTYYVSGVVGGRTYYWNKNTKGQGTGSIVGYSDKNDPNVAKIQFHYQTEIVRDPYGLDGKTYGIAYQDGSKAAAMTDQVTTSGSQQRLASEELQIKPDVLDHQGKLLVSEESDITEWTFECLEEDKYYIKKNVGGVMKYVTIRNGDLTLEDTPDSEGSVLRAVPGTDSNSGKWQFTANGYSIALPDGTGNGFNSATGNGATTWLNLVEKTNLDNDDFCEYKATKVSISDTENVFDGQQVVIYTRLWNEDEKKYEYYVVDHDGTLIPCFSSGDNIAWVGNNVNTALWDFTEYTEKDGTPNYYYELQNTQYGEYIAPQMTDDQILSENKIGINIDGRRYGHNYSTIIAWDDDHYEYAGLKSENGKIVSCPLDEAHDYYFAVMDLKEPQTPEGELTTVDTINNNKYGITMKMIDYNNAIVKNRDSLQTSVLGYDTNKTGLLSTDLKANGYPDTTGGNNTPDVQSLSNLYNNTTAVNHLFIESVYNESGYFEYDSTQNFAHLNESGDFTVYDQLGAIDNVISPTRSHGQFMPYNDLVEGQFSTATNQTTVDQQPLEDTDPRKGEKLYLIPKNQADYFFGMEMEASFTQTADGLDDWGHDIIFEFTGDDDFWFYVDGELVLDLGGVHSAMSGSINFRTGEVKSSRGNSSLYEIFESNFRARGLSNEEIAQRLDDIFKLNDYGNYVFKDYTSHTMKMFYMERGSGASNLKMRFNLASLKQGTAILSKTLSGTESASNKLIDYPYQIWYRTRDLILDPDTGEPELDEQGKPKTKISDPKQLIINENDQSIKVVYNETNKNVPFKDTYRAGNQTYSGVFLLKPGEEAEIDFPENTVDYKIVECGVDTDIYDHVCVNEVEIFGRPFNPEDSPEQATGSQTETVTYDNSTRSDFETDYMDLSQQARVNFDNHVPAEAVRTMTITKRLFDSDGSTLLHYPENSSLFTFRLYLGSENDDPNQLPLADMYEYHVKDADGNYCHWNVANKKFESIGKSDYSTLTAAEKKSATFTTSMNGSISKIPADYTVEVRDLIVGVQYKVEERDYEIPKGYTLRLQDGYQRVDSDPVQNTETNPISGDIMKSEDPEILVSNQKGWGLTVNKVWTDGDFMEEHDPIYFAVYVKDEDDQGQEMETLVDGTVRQMTTDVTSLYYFFGQLQAGTPFEDYVVREVTLAVPSGEELVIDDEGYVTGYEDVTPISENGTLRIDGRPCEGEYSQNNAYEYKVKYEQGEQTTHNENVRTDTVTNSRPGIELYKTNWAGQPLQGAVFSLKDASGNHVALSAYTSDESGLITTAYLLPGTYTLEETKTPKGFLGMGDKMTIIIKDDGTIDQVSGVDSSIYSVSTGNVDMNGTITIKNRASDLQVIKIDESDNTLLEGVHFALYHQVTDNEGNKRKDLYPIPGYEDLVTDANGFLAGIDTNLAVGTYYLTETSTLTGYGLLSEDLCFTIAKDGSVSIDTQKYANWLTSTTDSNGKVSYTLTIKNGKQKNVIVKKVSAGSTDVLQGATFVLYLAEDYDDTTGTPNQGAQPVTEGTTGADGTMDLGMLSKGSYRLVETQAPAGFIMLEEAVKIEVRDDGVTANQAGNTQAAEHNVSEDTYQISVWNTAGVELPSAGGPGTTWIYLLGAVLFLGCLSALVVRRRMQAR